MGHIDYIGPDGDKWPSATELTNLIPQDWVWAWYKSQVKKHGWRGWQKCLAQSNRGKRIGTATHNLIESFIKKQAVPHDSKDQYNAQQYADALFDAVNPRIEQWLAIEKHVLSNKLRVHGTVDLIAIRKDDGKAVVGDWKTGADKSNTHPIQLAIYAFCANEENPGLSPIEEGFIARVNKKTKSLTVKIDEYTNLAQYYPVIQSLRQLYDYSNSLGAFKKNG